MSEFDEMLRAGVISPGSQPFVESKKPTPTGEGLPTATITVVGQTQTSGPARIERPRGPRPSTVRDGPILLLVQDQATGTQLRDRLKAVRPCMIETEASALDLGFRPWSILVVDAELPGYARVLEVPLPVVVLAREAAIDAAERALGARKDEVLMTPVEAEPLLRAVQAAIARAPLRR